MNKQLVLGGMVAAVLLLGAGCDNSLLTTEPPTSTTESTATSTNTTGGKTETAPIGDFAIVASVSGKNTVTVQWTKPGDMGAGNTIRILNSIKENPELPTAYWYERSIDTAVDAEVPNVPSGKRYFRICEFNGTQCVRYSNTVQVDVP